MADSSNYDYFVSCGIIKRTCIPSPSPSPSPLIQINFNFFFTHDTMNWIQDQESIWLSAQECYINHGTAVANVKQLSLTEEIIQPIEKVLEPLVALSRHEQLTQFVWENVCEIESEIMAGNNVVNMDIRVVTQDNRLYPGESYGFSRESSCCVCLEDLSHGGGHKLPLGLPCSHFFHLDCIRKWVEKSGSCPLCRHQTPRLTYYLGVIRRRVGG